jgi:hypothetical protein
MYCPQCNSEYREGFTTCAECQIPLIEGSPEEIEELDEEEPGLRVLLETTHPTALDPIIVRLEERGIPYIVQSGTALSLLEGLMIERLPEDWKAVVLVPSEHLEAAGRIASEPATEQPTNTVEEE